MMCDSGVGPLRMMWVEPNPWTRISVNDAQTCMPSMAVSDWWAHTQKSEAGFKSQGWCRSSLLINRQDVEWRRSVCLAKHDTFPNANCAVVAALLSPIYRKLTWGVISHSRNCNVEFNRQLSVSMTKIVVADITDADHRWSSSRPLYRNHWYKL